MPIYEYRCSDCETTDFRVAATFEDFATCHLCGGLMLRLSDPFAPEPAKPCAWCQKAKGEVSGPRISHGICQHHAEEFMEEARCITT